MRGTGAAILRQRLTAVTADKRLIARLLADRGRCREADIPDEVVYRRVRSGRFVPVTRSAAVAGPGRRRRRPTAGTARRT